MEAYHNLAASYDRLTEDVPYEKVAAFYEQIWTREGLQPRTAVDLACGTGSIAVLLSQKGIQVTGVDLSEEMLTQAMAKAMDAQQQIQFACQPLQ